MFARDHAAEEVVVALNYRSIETTSSLEALTGSARYASLFTYGAAPSTLTPDASGSASLAMPAQSVQVFVRN